jgi:hypothetical protein
VRAIKILLLGLLLSIGASVQASDWHVEGADRVVAIADVHGAYDAMVRTLTNVGILDDALGWSGGTSRLIIVGDLLDRGPRSRDAMDLLMRLESEAQEAGGYVHVLIGNHESMNMIGDLRYVSKEEYAAFAPDETEEQRDRWFGAWLRRQPMPRDAIELRTQFDSTYPAGYFALREAFGPEGRYGKWLLQKPIVAVINGTAFVHGGLSPAIADYGLDGINKRLQGELAAYVTAVYRLMDAEILLPTDASYDLVDILDRYMPKLDEPQEILNAIAAVRQLADSDAISTAGPLWYRANVACNGIIEEHRLDAALAAIGAERVVVGHTPTPNRRVLQRFDGRLVEIDTGMLNFYYRGSGNALVISDGDVLVHNQAGGAPYAPLRHQRSVGQRPRNMPPEELAELLLNGQVVSREEDDVTGRDLVEISDGDHTVTALFERRRSRGFYPDLAAYRLDRLLDLDMVPVTVRRGVEGKDGTVQYLPPKTMDEEQRSLDNRGYSATCPLGEQLMAMYVFDTLVYNEGRTRQRMLYDTRNWRLMLVEHERAFSPRKGRPRYLVNASLEFSDGWKIALDALDATTLRESLGDVLDKKRLNALLARRDEILAEKVAMDSR